MTAQRLLEKDRRVLINIGLPHSLRDYCKTMSLAVGAEIARNYALGYALT